MAGSKGLATSGQFWGLSCVVDNEASMGVILGHMKLFGATDIGFDIVRPAQKAKRRKDPTRVASGRKGGLARQKARRSTAGRQPLNAGAEEFVERLTKSEFRWAEFVHFMEKVGWKGSASHGRALNHLIAAKRVKKKSRGLYIKLPALVKKAS